MLLIGDSSGAITQNISENKKIIKESYKNESHDYRNFSMAILNNMIASGDYDCGNLKIWNI